MQIIIANGPPYSGKDTFVNYILQKHPEYVWCRFKDILYIESYARLFPNKEIEMYEWVSICNNVSLKDIPLPKVLTKENISLWQKNEYNGDINISPRNELIYQSEDVIKKDHGEAGVAYITCQNIKKDLFYKEKTYIFSDGGFNVEVNALKEYLNTDNIIVVRIEADGCTFDNDSREYIDNPTYTIFNDKTNRFFDEIDKIL